MGFIKKDITDEDIENLFDKNITDSIIEKDSEPQEASQDLIPKELSVNGKSDGHIKRPDQYTPSEKRIESKKITEENKETDKNALLNKSGSVTLELFKRITDLRKKALLEEFTQKQRKLPVVNPNARYKLYNDQPKCTFHVYVPSLVLDNNTILTGCKFCSQQKTFTMQEWKKYEVENRKFM